MPLIPTGRTYQEEAFDEAAEAVQRAGAHADRQWRDIALEKVRNLAIVLPELTTDNVWLALSETMAITHEPRALGAIMLQASRSAGLRYG